MMMAKPPSIAVLGASGLIGEAVTIFLLREGFFVTAIARKFTASQKAAFGPACVECPIISLNEDALATLLAQHSTDLIVNCIGVLQDSPRGATDSVHRAFVQRLVKATASTGLAILLIQISIPGDSSDDRTRFAQSKREAERIIAAGSTPFVILRPSFVIAPAAYGGSALVRALGALPFTFPRQLAEHAFASTDVGDISRTVGFVARRWRSGEKNWKTTWDVMAPQPTSVGNVIGEFRRHFGGSKTQIPVAPLFMSLGAKAGDIVSHLGWSPPIRSTALEELRRGVTGNPEAWMNTTGIHPTSLQDSLRRLTPTVQERWFARLYLMKALILFSLVVFWIASGLIALTVSFDAATAILTLHGFPPVLAGATTAVSSVVDIAVGLTIAWRKTCRIGLIAGVMVSLGYMAAAAILTPDLWIEPLGALVKTAPAIVLMLVAWGILDER